VKLKSESETAYMCTCVHVYNVHAHESRIPHGLLYLQCTVKPQNNDHFNNKVSTIKNLILNPVSILLIMEFTISKLQRCTLLVLAFDAV
jgi:hypothetical protein